MGGVFSTIRVHSILEPPVLAYPVQQYRQGSPVRSSVLQGALYFRFAEY